ncbi:MAG: NADH-quinone oxidoreductase subunit NuoE [Gammaproteobacteria bacterium]|nr:NADH-quinone oxidoreductase subunit NuoE [Gammaproteobacteria bacterium]MCW8987733.1 NADH-quinone oxidoreductase subunit NuoE [Gammaproteobacteria bacterium]MCW9031577.1 NADH-quinone oxidoreductase subunit NuoE [Gammaproteobacteria bacterium]
MIGYKKKDESKLHLLTEASLKEIDVWINKYPADKKQSAVMSALRIAQDQNRGFLTEDLMDAVAEYLDMRPIAVYEVATFYSMYELEPVGKHKIYVCTNISCMLCGSDTVVGHLSKKLGINLGETTVDGRFTLKEVECLGACVNAPVMQIGDTYHENLTEEKIDQVIDALD